MSSTREKGWTQERAFLSTLARAEGRRAGKCSKILDGESEGTTLYFHSVCSFGGEPCGRYRSGSRAFFPRRVLSPSRVHDIGFARGASALLFAVSVSGFLRSAGGGIPPISRRFGSAADQPPVEAADQPPIYLNPPISRQHLGARCLTPEGSGWHGGAVLTRATGLPVGKSQAHNPTDEPEVGRDLLVCLLLGFLLILVFVLIAPFRHIWGVFRFSFYPRKIPIEFGVGIVGTSPFFFCGCPE